MEVEKIKLTNFRSHENFTANFSGLNILIGPNGSGKTNVIEAISASSTTKSHRTSNDRDLIMWEKEYSRIELNLKSREDTLNLSTFITISPEFSKKHFINSTPKRGSQIVGTFQTVTFSPETMDLVFGPPSIRRRFCDIVLCQSKPGYMRTLNKYNKVIRERNKLLYFISLGHSSLDELDFWDNEVYTLGCDVINSREDLIQSVNRVLSNYYQQTSGNKEKAEIIYKKSIPAEKFLDALKDRKKDIKYCVTLFGPHRDDLLFYLDDHPLVSCGSRGECRNFVLSIKLAEINYFVSVNGTSPVLLLDDVFSELDRSRRDRLVDTIQDQQTIISATDLNQIDTKIVQHAKIIELG